MTTHTATLTIEPVDRWDDLYHRYPSQSDRQPCYIELDCRSGVLRATWTGEIGNAIPMSVYHGHDIRWEIPCLTADAANDLMAEISDLARRILAGYESNWDGHNMVGRLTDDASRAVDEIAVLINDLYIDESNGVSGIEAGDYLAEWLPDDLSATSTDEEIEEMAAAIAADAADTHYVVFGLVDYLTEIRDRMREDAA